MAKLRWANVVLIAFLLVAFSVGAVEMPAQAGSSGDDWLMFRHDLESTGFTNSSAPKSTPAVAWSAFTEDAILTAPAVSGGYIYVTHENGIYALNASTGTQIWRVHGGGIWSSPAIYGGYVYTGADGGTAYNATSGKVKWSLNLKGDARSPVVADGIVYFGIEQTDVPYGLYAFNASTGTQLWTKPGAVYADPAVADGRVYVGTAAFNASTGDLLWEYQSGFGGLTSPAVSNGYVYVNVGYSVDGSIVALNSSTGEKIWNYTTTYLDSQSSPAVAYGQVFVGTGFDGNVVALNASTGQKIWNYAASGVNSSPVVADGVVYVGSDDGNLYAFNAFSGSKLWNFRVEPEKDKYGYSRSKVASPAIANGTIYIGSTDGVLYALTANPNATFAPFVWLAIAIAALVIVAAVILLIYFKKRRR